MRKLLPLFVFIALSLSAGAVSAGQSEVPAYPGSIQDETASIDLRELVGGDGMCYRTGDDIQKVAAFYKKQGLTPFRKATAERVTLQNQSGLNVSLQSPWLDPRSGKYMKETLICVIPPQIKGSGK